RATNGGPLGEQLRLSFGLQLGRGLRRAPRIAPQHTDKSPAAALQLRGERPSRPAWTDYGKGDCHVRFSCHALRGPPTIITLVPGQSHPKTIDEGAPHTRRAPPDTTASLFLLLADQTRTLHRLDEVALRKQVQDERRQDDQETGRHDQRLVVQLARLATRHLVQ